MTAEFSLRFDPDTRSWESAPVPAPGPAGVVSVDVGPGVAFHADAWSGAPVALFIDAIDHTGRLHPDTADAAHTWFGAPPAAGTTLRVAHNRGLLLARCALARAEADRHAAQGFGAGAEAWASDTELPTPDPGPAGPTVTPAPGPPTPDPGSHGGPDARRRAQRAVLQAATVPGRLAPDGPVAVDPSWIPGDLVLVRSLHSHHDERTGLVTLGCAVRAGVYAPEVGRIHAALVEDATDRVVALGTFAPERSGGAHARLAVGPGRPLQSVSLVLTADVRCVPSAALRRRRAATDLGRRAAQALRLGLTEHAATLLGHALDQWQAVGTPPSCPEIPDALRSPFAGELADLGA